MKINEKKVALAKEDVIGACGCKTGCATCATQREFIDKMADAFIPVLYWDLKMSDFTGAANIKADIEAYIGKLAHHYKNGTNLCLSGTLGTGKTYSIANVLKAAIAKKYSACYVSLPELVSLLTSPTTKHDAAGFLSGVDFLAIDEVDSRHIAQSDAAQDFYGASFEKIVRSRVQNKLPTIMATNNASLEEAFNRQFKKTIESLMAKCVIVSAIGKDHRKEKA